MPQKKNQFAFTGTKGNKTNLLLHKSILFYFRTSNINLWTDYSNKIINHPNRWLYPFAKEATLLQNFALQTVAIVVEFANFLPHPQSPPYSKGGYKTIPIRRTQTQPKRRFNHRRRSHFIFLLFEWYPDSVPIMGFPDRILSLCALWWFATLL